MTKQETKLKAENLLNEISLIAPLNNEKCIEVALLIVDKILSENPTREYWDTYDDETPSAVTVWNEVKYELEKLKYVSWQSEQFNCGKERVFGDKKCVKQCDNCLKEYGSN